MRRQLRLALSLSLLLSISHGVASEPPPPVASKIPGVERVTVRLAQFDVVVRDRSGKIVSGLGPADFRVVEDGSPLEVVAVDEWGRTVAPASQEAPAPTAEVPPPTTGGTAPQSATPAPEPTEPERRSFILVFDALGDTTALRMSQAKRAAASFVNSRMKSGDLGAVYQLDLSLRPVSGITADRDALVRGIDKIAWMPPSSLADQVNESVLAYTNQATAPYQETRLKEQSANVAGQLDWQREHTYSQLNDLAGVFQGMPGKRVLVLVSPGFPMTTNADQRLQQGGFTPKFQKLIKSLATYGVTVYSLDIGNDLSAGDAANAIDWRVAVGKLGLDENVLSDLGLETTLGTNTATSRREFLGVIAAESGGRMLTYTDLSKAFAAIDEESTRFYRISCRVPVTTDANRYRRFKVTVVRDGYTVSSRRGRYSDVTPFERTASNSATATAVESLAGYRRLTTQGTAVALPSGGAAKIPVAVVMRAMGPIDVTADPQGRGELDLEIRIVARAADEVVARYERSFTAKVRPEGLGAVRSAFRIEGRLELVPGIYEVQGTVRLASPPQVGTWTGIVAVPPQPKATTPTILGPVLSVDGPPLAPVLSRPVVDEATDALTVKPGLRLLPAASLDFHADDAFLALFWLRDFAESGDKPPAIDVAVRVIDSAGQDTPAPTQLVYFGPAPSGGYRAVASVDCSKLASGTYLLQIAATPPGGTTAITRRSAPFTLSPRASAPVAPAAPVATSSSTP
jgi:VWFA-related protein